MSSKYRIQLSVLEYRNCVARKETRRENRIKHRIRFARFASGCNRSDPSTRNGVDTN